MRWISLVMALALLMPAVAIAGDAEVEIEHLITTVGESGCTFIRNGSRHDAEDAASHMRLKYRRGKRYATTAELFIERLASKSSFTGKPYKIECPGSDAVPSGDWLMARLHEFREQQASAR
ncbi:MAG TPA: DUF5329 domain-containing protein [Woeseiaceae bacterium]|nr:DUF5329 domain-containing protein [Woeseiaceae bacterium]